jgi:hypothetical protein
MDSDPIARLVRWYAERCDGEWEHQHGVKLESLDNPGWLLEVDLGPGFPSGPDGVVGTDGDPPTAASGFVHGPSWLSCEVRNGRFVGAGDPSRLLELVERFLAWADEREAARR